MAELVPPSAFSLSDVAVIVLTMNRPQSLERLLTSLTGQSGRPGRVIIVDGGHGSAGIVAGFADRLPIEHVMCHPPGQIRQRNMALAMLDDRTRLVALLDDDLVLETGAFDAMAAFWNTRDDQTAGVSFNVVNNPPFRHSAARALIGMSSPRMGAILPSGYNVPIAPASEDLAVDWLSGGATVWRQRVLLTHRHAEVRSRWAICEDILYSYPLSKTYGLYVCAGARVRHEHVYDHTRTVDHRFYGRTATLWRMHFVNSNPDLSKVRCALMLLAQALARLGSGVIRRQAADWNYGIGQIQGLRLGWGGLAAGRSLVPLLEA